MYKNVNVIFLKDDSLVDVICSIAAKYDLVCTYKIGVYGKFRQHELEIIGPERRYKKFIKEVNTSNQNENDN